MKKLFILIIPILLLCGCKVENDKNYYTTQKNINFDTYVDEETCIEYFVSNGYYNKGSVSVRYNQDGLPKLNEQCLGE